MLILLTFNLRAMVEVGPLKNVFWDSIVSVGGREATAQCTDACLSPGNCDIHLPPPPVHPAHQCLRSAQMLSSPSSSSFSSSSSSSSPLTVQQREPAGQPAGPAPSSSCDLQNLTLIQQLFKIFFAHEPQQGSEKRAKVRREKGEEIETSWRICKASCGARARCPSTWQSCSVLTQLTIT